jgi:hypothetical protein
MTDRPDGKRWGCRQDGRRSVPLIVIILVLAFGLIAFWWASLGPPIVGVWKETDTYGHEHYFEFRKDGSLTYWDCERQHGGSFTEGPRFRGSYITVDRRTVSATTVGGWPAKYLGRLKLVSENELRQEGGFAMRDKLVY